MCSSVICLSSHQTIKCRLVNSGPLSQRITSGFPRWLTIQSSTRVTRPLDRPVSTSIAGHSRVKRRVVRKNKQRELTIGVDLGDKTSRYCVLDREGNVL